MAESLSRVLAFVAVFALVAAGAACSSSGEPQGRKAGGLRITGGDGGAKPVPVEVATLRTGSIEAVLRFSANVEAERGVQVVARAPGLVRKVFVEEGDAVVQNQVLLRLEDEEQRVQLARVDNDLQRARRELDKQKALRERGVVSEQVLENATYEVKRLELARQDASRAVRYATVRAPIAGTVTRRLVERGANVPLLAPLFEITDYDSLVVRVYVPEKDVASLGLKQSARIVTRTGAEHTGAVERIAPLVDPKSGTVKVTVALPRPEAPTGKRGKAKAERANEPADESDLTAMMPGMYVDVELVTEVHDDAVLLPKRALVYDDEVPYAFKVVGDKVAKVRVEARLESRDAIEPATGFEAGDRVVIAGQVGLKDGAQIEVAETPPSATHADAALADGDGDGDGDDEAKVDQPGDDSGERLQ